MCGRGKVRFMSISSHNRPMLPKLIAGYAPSQPDRGDAEDVSKGLAAQ